MNRILSKEECMKLDIKAYNKAMEYASKEENLSVNLSTCEHCGRKYNICCICDEAEKRWNDMIAEVIAVSERDRSEEKNIKVSNVCSFCGGTDFKTMQTQYNDADGDCDCCTITYCIKCRQTHSINL